MVLLCLAVDIEILNTRLTMIGLRCLVLSLLLLVLGTAAAQGRCPPRMYETGSRDYIGCAPIPGYNQSNSDSGEDSSSPIPTVWETRWGAIATEPNGGGFGAVHSFKSEVVAIQAAVEQCRLTASVSKTKCEVKIAYHNQCAVYAWGAGHSVASHAVDIPTATEDALASCKNKSGSECKIYYSGCSYAEAVAK